jgi:thiol-disulfide isomerase/thioredoxin
MPVMWLSLIFLCCIFPPPLTPQEAVISPEELAEFGLTRYTDKRIFPLEDLATLSDAAFDPAVLRGKYVFLNFWATWCPHCAKEKPSIEQLYQEKESDRFTVLTVSLGEEGERVREYMETHNYSFPVLVNPSNSLRKKWAPRIPATYILDTEGSIIARIKGNKDWASVQAKKVLEYVMRDL